MRESPEDDFRRFCEYGDPAALGRVFDALAPELLLVAMRLASSEVAEDLVQATFLVAMERRDAWNSDERLAPWLVGILANHVREHKRQRRRVPDPHRMDPRGTAAPESPSSDLEAREVAEQVRVAVSELPVQYRQVLALRLLHGFELTQIAQSLGLPLGTVKTRLRRGLENLRRVLPATLTGSVAALATSARSLAVARAVVLERAGTVTPTTGVAAVSGTILGVMAMKKMALGVAAIVAIFVGGWAASTSDWYLSSGEAPVESVGADLVVAAAASSAEEESVVSAARESDPERTTMAVAAGAMMVRLVWQHDGSPVRDMDILVRRRVGPKLRRIASQKSGSSGGHLFTGLKPGRYYVTSSRSGEMVAVAGRATTNCTLTIEGGITLEAHVVDADGASVAGADVWASPSEESAEIHNLGSTDDTGRIVRRLLKPGIIWARMGGFGPAAPVRLGSDATTQHRIRIQLGRPAGTILGNVVDPHERAVPGAMVVIVLDDTLRRPDRPPGVIALHFETDSRGEFRCDEVPYGIYPVMAIADGFALGSGQAIARAEPTEPVRLRLREGARVVGRVTDSAGRPVPGARIHAVASTVSEGFDAFRKRLLVRQATTNLDGRYRLDAVHPAAVRLRSEVPQRTSVTRQVELEDGQEITWNVELSPVGSIHGRVVDLKGRPLPSWRVEAIGRDHRAVHERFASTDGEGRFRIHNLPMTIMRISVFHPGAKGAASLVPHASTSVRTLEGGDEKGDEKGVLLRVRSTAGAGSWLTGRVDWPTAEKRGRAKLSLYPRDRGRGTFSVPQQDVDPVTGAFRIGPLPAGVYDLLCDPAGRARLAQRGVRLGDDQSLELPPFDLAGQRPLHLELRHEGGEPAVHAVVRLADPELGQLIAAESRPGRYRTRHALPGTYVVTVRGEDFAPMSMRVRVTANETSPTRLTVPRGERVEFRFHPVSRRARWIAAMDVHLQDDRGESAIKATVQIDGKESFVWRVGLTPGRYSLKSTVYAGGIAETEFEVKRAAGDAQVVDVQLKSR